MKVSCTSFSFNRDITSGKKNLETFFDICKGLDISGVEVWDEHTGGYTTENFYQLKRMANKYGLELITFAVNNHDFTSRDSSLRKLDIDKVNKWIEITNLLECKILRVLPGDLIALNKDKKNSLPFSLECFEKCLDKAIKNNIVLAIENCPKNTDPAVVVDIVKYFNSKYLMLCPDIGNIRADIRYKAFEPLLPWAVHIHAKTYDFDREGNENSIDYHRVLRMIQKYNFKEYISIEYEGEKDELWGIKNSMSLLKHLM
jgi:sugar phosphate isomerase/epimerase